MSSFLAAALLRLVSGMRAKAADRTAQRRRQLYKDRFWTTVEQLEDRTLLSGVIVQPPPPPPLPAQFVAKPVSDPPSKIATAVGELSRDVKTDLANVVTPPQGSTNGSPTPAAALTPTLGFTASGAGDLASGIESKVENAISHASSALQNLEARLPAIATKVFDKIENGLNLAETHLTNANADGAAAVIAAIEQKFESLQSATMATTNSIASAANAPSPMTFQSQLALPPQVSTPQTILSSSISTKVFSKIENALTLAESYATKANADEAASIIAAIEQEVENLQSSTTTTNSIGAAANAPGGPSTFQSHLALPPQVSTPQPILSSSIGTKVLDKIENGLTLAETYATKVHADGAAALIAAIEQKVENLQSTTTTAKTNSIGAVTSVPPQTALFQAEMGVAPQSPLTQPDGVTPTLIYNNGITTDIGGSQTILPYILQAGDPEHADSEIVFTLVDPPASGQLTLLQDGVLTPLQSGSTFTQQDIDDGLLAYWNNGEQMSSDSFTFTLSFAGDEVGEDAPQSQFAITVNPDAPGATIPTLVTDGGMTIDEGGSQTITSDMLQAADPDHADSEIVYTLVDAPAYGHLTLQQDGVPTVLESGSTFTQQDIDDGLLTYTHDGSETQSDSFTFTLSFAGSGGIGGGVGGAGGFLFGDGGDGGQGGAPAGQEEQVPSQFVILVNPVNDAPSDLSLDSTSVAENQPAGTVVGTLSATDPDTGDALSYSLVGGGDNDSFQIVDNQLQTATSLDYEAQNSYTVTVQVMDSAGATSQQQFTIDVTDIDDKPVAQDDTVQATEDGGPVTFNVGTNDSFSTSNATWQASSTITADQGQLVGNDNGSFTFTPAANFNGQVVFSYTLADADGQQSTANVTINVAPVNDAPVATDGYSQTLQEQPTLIDLGATASDLETSNENLMFDVVDVTGGAAISTGGNGHEVQFTPAEGFVGTAEIHVRVTDTGDGDSPSTSTDYTYYVNVIAPTANDDVQTTNEDTPVTFDARLNDDVYQQSPSNDVAILTPAEQIPGTAEVNGDGTITFTPAQNFSGDAVFQYQLINGEGEQTTGTVTVHVTPVADTPTLDVSDVSGDEDTAIPLNLSSELVDPSETLSVVVSGIPDCATLSDGTNSFTPSGLHDTVDIAAWDRSSLTITPPANSDAPITLNIVATSTEQANGDAATTSGSFTVTVNAVADTPTLTVRDAAATEDTAQQLFILPSLTDTDGSESLELVVSGIPAGAMLTDGNNTFTASSECGSVDISTWDRGELFITPPANSDVSFTLTITATSVETSNGDRASTSAPIVVTVNAVADAPNLTVSPARGDEDTPIPLDVSTSLVDADGSESLVLVASDIPVGATLSDGSNTFVASANQTSVDITSWDLTKLTVQAPSNSDADFTLTFTSTTTEQENGSTAQTVKTLRVTVDAVADAPYLAVQPAQGREDTPIPLSITSSLNDTDGSESLSLSVSNIPVGATLTDGTHTFQATQGNTAVDITSWDLSKLTVQAPFNSDVDFRLAVTATATEADHNNANSTTQYIAVSVGSSDVTVDAVADAPNLSTSPARGNEDTAIPLTVSTSLVDTDGSESLATVASGIPAGATLTDGTHTFTATSGSTSVDITGWSLSSLKITPPSNSGDDFTLTFTSTSTEAANHDQASTVKTLRVTVDAVADAPNLATSPARGDEDTPIPLVVSTSLVDTDGSESLVLVASGLPVGSTLSDGTHTFVASAGHTSVDITSWDLTKLTVQAPSNSDVDFTLTFTSTTTEAENGSTAQTVKTLRVTVDAVADTPNLSVQGAAGREDTPIPLTITSSLNDTDGSETLSLSVGNLPAGATLTDGTHTFHATPGHSSVDITNWDLTKLTVQAPLNSDADMMLSVTATSTEAENQNAHSTTQYLAVTVGDTDVVVDAVADAPNLSTSPARGNEDTAIPLTVSTSLVDTDGSESLALVASGIPAGATLTDGTHTFVAAPGSTSVDITSWDLKKLTITPPYNSGDDFTLTFTSTSTEAANHDQASTVKTLRVTVDAVADAPVLNVAPATGKEDTAIPLSVNTALVDTDGSESLQLTLSGVPSGAVLSDGTHTFTGTAGSSSVDVTNWDLTKLTITPPLNDNHNFTLTLTSTTTEAENHSQATTQKTILVTVLPVNDAPIVANTSGTIDDATKYSIDLWTLSSDVETPTPDLQYNIVSSVGGTATIGPDGHTVTFTPDPDFVGTGGFTYAVTDTGDRLSEAPTDPDRQPLTTTGTATLTITRYQDLGDAPDSYNTIAPDQNNPGPDGARHGGTHDDPNPVRLGNTVGYGESNGQPSTGANADSGDDGILIAQSLGASDDDTLMRTLQVKAPAGGKLDAWIDFNGDGKFEEDERLQWVPNPGQTLDGDSLVLSGAPDGIYYVTFRIPAHAVNFASQDANGQIETYARFRISTQGNLDPTGFARDGEVEDYLVSIKNLTGASQEFNDAYQAGVSGIIQNFEILGPDPYYNPLTDPKNPGMIVTGQTKPGTTSGSTTGSASRASDTQGTGSTFTQGDTDPKLQNVVGDVNTQSQTGISASNTFIFVCDPVDFLITDPEGRRVGTLPDGEFVNDFGDNVTYSGDGAVEMLTIQNASAGQYDIQFTGTGGVFRGGASLITANGTQESTFQGALAAGQTVELSLVYDAPAIKFSESNVADASGKGQAFFNVNDTVAAEDEESLANLAALEDVSTSNDPREQLKRWIDTVSMTAKSARRVMLDELTPDFVAEHSPEMQGMIDEFWTGLGQSMMGGIPGQVYHLGRFLGAEVPMLFAPDTGSNDAAPAKQDTTRNDAPEESQVDVASTRDTAGSDASARDATHSAGTQNLKAVADAVALAVVGVDRSDRTTLAAAAAFAARRGLTTPDGRSRFNP